MLDGAAPGAAKRQLLKKLKKCFGAIAGSAPGSFLVEKCYQKADAAGKEAIVAELADRTKELQVSVFGILQC